MTEDEREEYAVIQRMETEFPKFAGKAKAFADSIVNASKYQQQWEEAHPGETFDPEDSQHDAFYAKNDVNIDQNHYSRTLARMESQQTLEKGESKLAKRLAELEAKEKLRDAEPKIQAAGAAAEISFFSMAGDEFAKVVDPNGNIDAAEIKRIVEADPSKSVIVQVAGLVPAFAKDLHKLVNGLVEFDEKNKGHVFIDNFATRYVKTVKEMPAAAQAAFGARLNKENSGTFIPPSQYNKLSAEERSQHWTLTEPDLARLYAAEQIDIAQKTIAEEENGFEARAKARGWQKVDGAPTPPVVAAKPAETPPEQRPKVKSPAATIAPMPAHSGGGNVTPPKNPTNSFGDDWTR